LVKFRITERKILSRLNHIKKAAEFKKKIKKNKGKKIKGYGKLQNDFLFFTE
jgi:DNA polymerase/3'-5' exonuclease PolX